jgi:xylulokinase
VLEAGGHRIAAVRIMDGGARSALWRQIVADVLGRAVTHAPGADLGSAHGAALVAGVAAGLWGWEDAPRAVASTAVHEPDPAAGARYGELYGVYRDLYARLAPAFAAVR